MIILKIRVIERGGRKLKQRLRICSCGNEEWKFFNASQNPSELCNKCAILNLGNNFYKSKAQGHPEDEDANRRMIDSYLKKNNPKITVIDNNPKITVPDSTVDFTMPTGGIEVYDTASAVTNLDIFNIDNNPKITVIDNNREGDWIYPALIKTQKATKRLIYRESRKLNLDLSNYIGDYVLEDWEF